MDEPTLELTEAQRQALRARREGASWREICEGPTRICAAATISDWCHQSPEFREMWEAASDAACQRWEGELEICALKASSDHNYQRSLHHRLRRHPAYRDQTTIRHEGGVSIRATVDADLRGRIDGLLGELGDGNER